MHEHNRRIHYFDWLKVIVFCMDFLLVVLLIFDSVGFYVENDDKIPSAGLIQVFGFWTMPVLFFFAGANARLSLGKRSSRQFLIERTRRLLIPYIFGILLIVPPQKYIQHLQADTFSGNYIEFMGSYLTGGIPLAQTSGPGYLFRVGHQLWFFIFLYLFSVMSIPVFRVFSSQRWYNAATERLGHAYRDSPWKIYLFILPIWIAYASLRPLFPDFCGWADFIFWLLFFLFGFLNYLTDGFGHAAQRLMPHSFIMGAASSYISLSMLPGIVSEGISGMEHYSLQVLIFNFFWVASAWAWLLFLVGMGSRYLSHESRLIRYHNKALIAYIALYQTVIVIVGYFIIQLSVGPLAKYLLIAAISAAATVLIYDLIIKRVPVIRALFGVKGD